MNTITITHEISQTPTTSQSLRDKEVKPRGNPRRALNSLLFILINGDSTPLPKNSSFSTRQTAGEYFLFWQANKVLQAVLPLLEEESEEPLQSYYRKLFENLQKISDPKTKPLSIFHFNKKFGQTGPGFCVTDRQWLVIEPLLNKKIIKSGRPHRRDLNSIFSVIMNCQTNPASLRSLKLKFHEIVESSFQGVTDKQWILIHPLVQDLCRVS